MPNTPSPSPAAWTLACSSPPRTLWRCVRVSACLPASLSVSLSLSICLCVCSTCINAHPPLLNATHTSQRHEPAPSCSSSPPCGRAPSKKNANNNPFTARRRNKGQARSSWCRWPRRPQPPPPLPRRSSPSPPPSPPSVAAGLISSRCPPPPTPRDEWTEGGEHSIQRGGRRERNESIHGGTRERRKGKSRPPCD